MAKKIKNIMLIEKYFDYFCKNLTTQTNYYMKRFFIFLTLCLLIGIGVVNAQNQRMVVVECFTSATCGPCASINPSLDNLLSNNESISLYIKYHVNWPSDHDPMNQHNPSEVAAKVNYYGVNSVPMSVIDGQWIGNSGSINQNLLNQYAAVSSPLEMRMSHYLNSTNDTIFVVVMGRATNDVASNNLKLNVGVIEKLMQYATAPGTNGEKNFHNVMKKMLPGSSGQSIPALNAGDYFVYKFSWALANVMDINQLSAVAWVQDATTKVIYQGCKSNGVLDPFYVKNCKISDLQHMQNYVCSGNSSPYVVVDNFGSEAITNLVLKVSVNGTEIKTVNWEGTIQTAHSAKIQLGDIEFETVAENELQVEVVTINGGADEYANSVYIHEFSAAEEVVGKSFKLVIRTDNDPQDVTWEVANTNTGDVVFSGGPYEEANKLYTELFELNEDGCYVLTIYDAGGNGLTNGTGYYGLKAGSKSLFSGSDFKDMESNEFSYANSTDVTENQENTLSIYPNPSNGFVTVDSEGSNNVSVYSIAGQNVYNQVIDGVSTIDLSSIGKGTYMIVVTNANGESAKQVIVIK